ncbi:MAG: DUF4440 domain-containing protein [Burkholderiaceae bacterium]
MILLVGAAPAFAAPADDAVGILAKWEKAFNAGDARAVVELYAPDATIFGTLSPTVSSGDGLRTYFEGTAKSRTQVKLLGSPTVSTLPNNVFVLAGLYEFSGTRANGQSFTAPARYSLVIANVGGKPLIVHQHSSPQPRPQ